MSVVQIEGVVRRGRGRPPARSDAQTLRVILGAASAEFPAGGYGPTSMATIARRAGVSTRTLYRLVPTKAELFRRMIADRTSRFVLTVDGLDSDSGDVGAGLERLLTAYGALVLDPEVLAIYRLVLGESARFPELGQTFHELAVRRTTDAMTAWLERQCARRLLRLDDPRLAAEMLRGMMAMEPQRAAMLGQAPPPDAAQITGRAKACARLFLEGCLV
jgi:AcrR family transcriptional regulator